MIISSPGRTEIPVGPGTRLAMLAVGGGGAGGARAGGGGAPWHRFGVAWVSKTGRENDGGPRSPKNVPKKVQKFKTIDYGV